MIERYIHILSPDSARDLAADRAWSAAWGEPDGNRGSELQAQPPSLRELCLLIPPAGVAVGRGFVAEFCGSSVAAARENNCSICLGDPPTPPKTGALSR